jgi:hypothetical protein
MTVQVVFLLVRCDWELSGDEAEFWAWSRRLDWSYQCRGPLIAWLIRLATELFGGTSERLSGSLMFAVRLPAVLLGGLTAWGVFRLSALATGDRRAALFAVLLLPAVPALAIGSVLATCDTPLVCCWTWAAVWSLRGTQSESVRPWLLAGCLAALGVMAKYTALAFPAAVGMFLLLSAPDRRHLSRPGFWAMTGICVGLGLAPILVWNARHNWAGLSQLVDRVGLSARGTWGKTGPILAFLGGDIGALGLIWWVAGVPAVLQAVAYVWRGTVRSEPGGRSLGSRRESGDHSGYVLLFCLWGVIWLACFVASVFGESEVNWMVPGYIGLVVLIGIRAGTVFARGSVKRWVLAAAWSLSLAAVVSIHHTEWFYPTIARWVPAPTKRWPAPLRLMDPSCRMRGQKTLAAAVETHMAALRRQGESPYVLTATYALTSTLSFYLPGQPDTYCLSWNYGMTQDPVNQHDLWHPNPRNDPDYFRERPALVVEDSNMPPNFAQLMANKGVFRRWEYLERVVVFEGGVVVGAWDISVCRDYRGIAGYDQTPLARR